jgi:hypothetical protein
MSEAGFNTHVSGLDPYLRFNDDICAGKHGGNIDSMIAWERIQEHVREVHTAILKIFAASKEPLAPKQVAAMLSVQFNTISGRFTELKQQGILRSTAQTWEHSRCLELVDRWIERVMALSLKDFAEDVPAAPVVKYKGEHLVRPFTEDEIEELGLKAGKYLDTFTALLNHTLSERLEESGLPARLAA